MNAPAEGVDFFAFFLYPAFSAFPEGSKEGDSFPDGCSRPGSHLCEVPEKAGGNGDVKDLENSKKRGSALKKVQGAPLDKTCFV